MQPESRNDDGHVTEPSEVHATGADGKNGMQKEDQQQQKQQAQDDAAPMTASQGSLRNPAGTRPGGRWFLHKFKGQRAQNHATAACCLFGPVTAAVVHSAVEDERFVYQEPFTSHLYMVDGRRTSVVSGRLLPMHSDAFMAPGAVYRDGTIGHDGTHVPMQQQQPQVSARNGAATVATRARSGKANSNSDAVMFPPGTGPGGFWHMQRIMGRKKRFVYRLGTKFFDKDGNAVDPRVGPLQPPVPQNPFYY